MSDSRSPFRGSLSAAALIGSLERALAPARELTLHSLEHGELVRLDTRLSSLLAPAEPFAALTAAASRLPDAPSATGPTIDRDFNVASQPSANRPRTATRSSLSVAPNHTGTTRSAISARVERTAPSTPTGTHARAQVHGVPMAQRAKPSAVSRLLADSPRALPRERLARAARELMAAAARVAPEPVAVPIEKKVGRSVALDSQQAHAIWQARAERVGLSDAFHSVVQRDAVSPRAAANAAAQARASWRARAERVGLSDTFHSIVQRDAAPPRAAAKPAAHALSHASAAMNASGAPSAEAAGSAFEAPPTSTAGDAASDVRAQSAPVLRAASATALQRWLERDRTIPSGDPLRRPTPSAAAGASGLRRLAAYASERLDESAPALNPAARATPTSPQSALADELDSLLRTELLQSGIDPRSLVR